MSDACPGNVSAHLAKSHVGGEKKKALYLSVNVFSTKALIGTLRSLSNDGLLGHYIFTSPNGDGTVILRGHPSHAKV